MFRCTDPMQVLLHVVCHCEGDQLSNLSPCCVSKASHSTVFAIYCPGHICSPHASLQHALGTFPQMSRDPGHLSFGVFQSVEKPL